MSLLSGLFGGDDSANESSLGLAGSAEVSASAELGSDSVASLDDGSLSGSTDTSLGLDLAISASASGSFDSMSDIG